MIRLDAQQREQAYQLLEMIEVCAAEARKGLAFGMAHAASANRPRVAIADRNGHMAPQLDSSKAAAGALQSFLNHAAQITHYARALVPLLQAAVGQGPGADAGGEDRAGAGSPAA